MQWLFSRLALDDTTALVSNMSSPFHYLAYTNAVVGSMARHLVRSTICILEVVWHAVLLSLRFTANCKPEGLAPLREQGLHHV